MKVLNGSAKHNPGREKDPHLMPQPPVGLGDPPDFFSDDLKTIWVEVSKTIPNGVACESDRTSFEMLCRVIHQIRTSDQFISSQCSQFVSLASRFGLTPADRQKVRVIENPKDNPFDDFGTL